MEQDPNSLPDPIDSCSDPQGDLTELLSQKVIGQPEVMKHIVPCIQMHQAGLAPSGRPVGIFLLLGPTGTGKTRTVEALAEILHGSQKNVVRIDCGEFQMEHEIAKLIGAPPGYLGHRETESLLTQQRLAAATSERSDISVVLFDEIEKAAPSVTQLLLGILDTAILRLGDNTEVNFEKSLIFFTSNLGAREMLREIQPQFGFKSADSPIWSELVGRLEAVALAALRKMYSPEFINRFDAVITYRPLDAESFSAILRHQIADLQIHVNTRLGGRCFNIEVPEESRRFLLERGTSLEFGARELKRTVHRYMTQPLATMVIEGRIEPGATVRVDLSEDGEKLLLRVCPPATPARDTAPHAILLVDDNQSLLRLLSLQLSRQSAWRILAAESVKQANEIISLHKPDLALLDYLLPGGNGVGLGVHLTQRFPEIKVILMTGAELPAEEEQTCREYGFQILKKPFLSEQLLQMVHERLPRPPAKS